MVAAVVAAHCIIWYEAGSRIRMFLFGHIGITLASAALGFGLKDRLIPANTGEKAGEISLVGSGSSGRHPGGSASFFRSLANRIDIRYLFVGSMLPDIIDKPIGLYIFRETFSNGRIFSHTLWFLFLVTAAGLILRRNSGKTWGLALSIGTLLHLILDQMWQTPETLFWPVFGIAFERTETTCWIGNIFYALVEEPGVYVPEIIGFIVFAWFAWGLVRRRGITRFLKEGRAQ